MSSIIKNRSISINPENKFKLANGITEFQNSISPQGHNDDIATNALKSKADELLEKIDKLSKMTEEAEKNYNNIIKETKKIKEDANKEIEEIKEQAFNEAFQNGYNEGMKNSEEEVENFKSSLQSQYEEDKLSLLTDLKNDSSNIIISVLKKVFDKVINEEHISYTEFLVSKALNLISDEKEIKIILNEDDMNSFNKNAILDKFDNEKINLSFQVSKDIKPNECQIETEAGYINSSFSNITNDLSNLINSTL